MQNQQCIDTFKHPRWHHLLYIPSSILERKSSICTGISSGLPSVFPVLEHCTSRSSSRIACRIRRSRYPASSACRIACTKKAFFCPSGTRCRISHARLWPGSSIFGRNEKTGRLTAPTFAPQSVHIRRRWHLCLSGKPPGKSRPAGPRAVLRWLPRRP